MRDVKKIRIDRELKKLDERIGLRYDHLTAEKAIVINSVIKIVYGPDFPFDKPKIVFLLEEAEKYQGATSMFDLNRLHFKDIMKEEFHPSLDFAEISERCLQFLEKNMVLKDGDKAEMNWF